MRYLFGFICVLALGVMPLVGCGEPADVGVDCDSNKVGMIECSADRSHILLCSADLRFEEVENCGASRERCYQEEGEPPACVCEEGWRRCSTDGTGIEVCQTAGVWAVAKTCSEGEICVDEDNMIACRLFTGDPMITEVRWEWVDPCSYMTPSDVRVTTTAIPAGLDYSGSVTDCDPDIVDAVAVLTCQNQTLMAGSVTVEDSENNQATVSFAFDACIDGRVCADGEPCCLATAPRRCSESDPSVIEQCAADGSWVLSETCEEGTLCNDDAVSAVCKAAECVDGDLRCFESDGWPGTDIEYCLNGTWVFSQSCQQRPDQSRPDWVCIINDNLDPPVYYCGAGP
jgi:hypothetical protein